MSSSTRVKVKNIGLAAYMRLHGARLLSVMDRAFVFDTDRAVSEWKLAYQESQEYKADQQVLALKRLLRESA